MVILGLDPGIAATGFGVVEAQGNRLQALAFGVIRTTPRTPHALRLATIYGRVGELVAAHEVAEAAVEELFMGPDPRGMLLLGQARGAGLAACGAGGLVVSEYSVATIKSAVCGYGRAEKSQVARMVQAILRLESPPDEHAADALAAAVCHAQHARAPGRIGAAT